MKVSSRLSLTAGLLLSLMARVNSEAGCGQAATGTITNLPPNPYANYQINSLNATGQLTGYFSVTFQHGAHALFYDNGALTDLGTFGGNTSYGFAINSSGQVAGQADLTGNVQTNGFLYAGGNLVNLGTLGGPYSTASAINDSGVVVGSSLPATGSSTVAFLYSNSTMVPLGTLGGTYSAAFAVNNAGTVAGESTTSSGDTHGFVYSGAMTDVGTLGGNYSTIYALSDGGQAVGISMRGDGLMHGFIYAGGAITDVGNIGGTFSVALGVNQSGQAIGVATTTNDQEYHGFIYSDGTITDLGTLGGSYSYADAINNLGQVVGETGTADGLDHAFIWEKGQMKDLNTLLPPNSGWELNSGLFINDAGRIVGVGVLNGVSQWYIMDLSTGNKTPVAVAGPDQLADCQTPVILDGRGSSDPDNDSLTFQWTLLGTVLGTGPVLPVSLPLGTNVVTLTVTDPCGASAQANVTVVVADTKAPTITGLPDPITLAADAHGQAVVPNVLTAATFADNCTPADQLVLAQDPTPGTVVGTGQFTINVSVKDAAGNTTTGSVSLTVVDKTPPAIQTLTVDRSILSPPNHALIPVTVSVTASDNCDPAPVSKIICITADGPTAPGDIQITGALTATLAASKNPTGNTRIYTLKVQCTDASGNSSLGTVYVTVPSGNSNGGGGYKMIPF